MGRLERKMEDVGKLEKKMEDLSNPWEHFYSKIEESAICKISVENFVDG
jgi:hypothetical protein